MSARRVVVGVDGSEASLAALRWAAGQASLLDAQLVAVHVWEPAEPGRAPYAPVADRPTVAEQRAEAGQLLADAVLKSLGGRVDVAVRPVLAEGVPSRVLLAYARDALFLAVGRSAHGSCELPAAGPVVRECLRYAEVPVVAVPAEP